MLTTSEQLAKLSDSELKARAYENSSVQLTDQQQALIAWNSRLQTRQSMRSYRRNAIIAFLVLLSGIFAARYEDINSLEKARKTVVRSGNAVAVSSCNRDFRTSLAQRRALILRPPTAWGRPMTAEERARDIRALTPLPDCRTSKRGLTDNPEKRVIEPAPLHEGLVTPDGRLEGGD